MFYIQIIIKKNLGVIFEYIFIQEHFFFFFFFFFFVGVGGGGGGGSKL